MSSRKKMIADNATSPSPQTAKETGLVSPATNASSPRTAVEDKSSASNAPSESNMQTIPDHQSNGSRSSIFHRKSSISQSATAQTANVRLATSILIFLSMNVCLILASRLAVWNLVVSRMLASLLAPFVAFFGYQWCHYYSIALTRKKRAFWVEPNILLTYQPRARYSGHLFKPDPPTPGVIDRDIANLSPSDQLAALQRQEDEVKNVENESEEWLKEDAKRNAFLKTRSQFYGGEWAAAVKGIEDRATKGTSAQTESLFEHAEHASSASSNIVPSPSGQVQSENKKDKKKE